MFCAPTGYVDLVPAPSACLCWSRELESRQSWVRVKECQGKVSGTGQTDSELMPCPCYGPLHGDLAAVSALKSVQMPLSRSVFQVFRTDLITAMKLHDSYQLNPDEYYVLADPWRQEWEKGVQVPVSPGTIPQPVAR